MKRLVSFILIITILFTSIPMDIRATVVEEAYILQEGETLTQGNAFRFFVEDTGYYRLRTDCDKTYMLSGVAASSIDNLNATVGLCGRELTGKSEMQLYLTKGEIFKLNFEYSEDSKSHSVIIEKARATGVRAIGMPEITKSFTAGVPANKDVNLAGMQIRPSWSDGKEGYDVRLGDKGQVPISLFPSYISYDSSSTYPAIGRYITIKEVSDPYKDGKKYQAKATLSGVGDFNFDFETVLAVVSDIKVVRANTDFTEGYNQNLLVDYKGSNTSTYSRGIDIEVTYTEDCGLPKEVIYGVKNDVATYGFSVPSAISSKISVDAYVGYLRDTGKIQAGETSVTATIPVTYMGASDSYEVNIKLRRFSAFGNITINPDSKWVTSDGKLALYYNKENDFIAGPSASAISELEIQYANPSDGVKKINNIYTTLEDGGRVQESINMTLTTAGGSSTTVNSLYSWSSLWSTYKSFFDNSRYTVEPYLGLKLSDFSTKIPVEPKSNYYTELELIQEPTKHRYVDGCDTSINLAGMQLKGTKADGTVDIIEGKQGGSLYIGNDYQGSYYSVTCDGYNFSQFMYLGKGKHTVNVVFLGSVVSYDIDIVDKAAEDIEVISLPEKTVYFSDDSYINWSGLAVKLKNADGISGNDKILYYDDDDRELYGILRSSYDKSMFATPGKHVVNFTVGGLEASFEIEVKKELVQSISLISNPVKDTYLSGPQYETRIDFSGLEYQIKFGDDNTVNFKVRGGDTIKWSYKGNTYYMNTSWKYTDGEQIKVGKNAIVVRYKKFGFEIPVTVLENTVEAIEWIQEPALDDDFYLSGYYDLNGSSIKITFTDGSTDTVQLRGKGNQEYMTIPYVNGAHNINDVMDIYTMAEEQIGIFSLYFAGKRLYTSNDTYTDKPFANVIDLDTTPGVHEINVNQITSFYAIPIEAGKKYRVAVKVSEDMTASVFGGEIKNYIQTRSNDIVSYFCSDASRRILSVGALPGKGGKFSYVITDDLSKTANDLENILLGTGVTERPPVVPPVTKFKVYTTSFSSDFTHSIGNSQSPAVVNKGEDYSFTVTSGKKISVKAGGVILNPDANNVYTIKNIRSDIIVTITVLPDESDNNSSQAEEVKGGVLLYDGNELKDKLEIGSDGRVVAPILESYQASAPTSFFAGWYYANGVKYRSSDTFSNKQNYNLYAKWIPGIHDLIHGGKTLRFRILSMDENGLARIEITAVIQEDKARMAAADAELSPGEIYEIPEDIVSEELQGFGISSGKVVSIQPGAITDESGIRRLTIPGSVKEIADNTFADCNLLRDIIFKDGVEKIGNNVFSSSIKNIVLPGSLKEMAADVFSNIDKTNVNIYGYEGLENLVDNIMLIESIDDVDWSREPGADHVHDLKKYAFVAPTCSEKGSRMHYECKICGRLFLDSAASKEISKAFVNLLENDKKHTGKLKVKNKKAATYFAKGYTGDTVCSSCKTVVKKGKAVAKKKLTTARITTIKRTSSSGKPAIYVKWTRNKVANGYELQRSTDKNFKKSVVKKKIKKNSTLKYTFNNVKKDKKYYVRIRAYKTSKNKKAYSSWVVKQVK